MDIIARGLAKKPKYQLKISTVPLPGGAITTKDTAIKVLCGVKAAKYRKDYLYASNEKTYNMVLGYLFVESIIGGANKVFYAPGVPDNIAEIGVFDGAVSSYGNPVDWHSGIGEDGEIIWVRESSGDSRPTSLPRVHAAGTYTTAPEVSITGDVPMAWLGSSGIDFARDASGNEYCMFGEYSKDIFSGNMYVWKVTKPYSNPANWTKVLTKVGDSDITHFHTCQYDPFSETWLVTSGDQDAWVKVWASYDRGANWDQVAGGSQTYRVANYIFTEDYIYWANDWHTPHGLYRIPRGALSRPDFSATPTKLCELSSWQSTYATIWMHSPSGLLVLDRVEKTGYTQLDVNFWSFEDNQLYKLKTIDILSDTEGWFGFRCNAYTLYQPINDNRIIVGFNEAYNQMQLPYNENGRLGSLALEIV